MKKIKLAIGLLITFTSLIFLMISIFLQDNYSFILVNNLKIKKLVTVPRLSYT